ncbi:hypothetical protein [Paenibacillus hunanensis]|uniref:Membrane protein implicated in regulation of membrane protease activity n=2 Tax=Paenibacillus hunanensis TaxID=539262 RepID=A0ABU1IWS8_9BACL|nr:hypothetical protein [Paenibacillus hunanensis]MCL9661131.1 hypothetical protein [Paenibacillus hunanensis]MDR6243700.1 membrane protein implicated in regulation of membrane protease activity [Paenibacillus hunanensis]GGJ24055.1 hypothetical protein GCM10008022_36320 [Paenibacillus hunanensis]
MTLVNNNMYKWISWLLVMAAIAVYVLFQTRGAVLSGMALLMAGIVIGLLTLPRPQRISFTMFYVVAVPVIYFIRAFM